MFNIFYSRKACTTWHYFYKTRSPHTLIIFIFLLTFAKLVTDFRISPNGKRSDHSDVCMQFKMWYIKLKMTYTYKLVVYWKLIQSSYMVNKKYNKNLFQ